MTASPHDAAEIIATAGGEIVGRTRLQKVTCLLEMLGLNFGFPFEYHLHGPYSETLRLAVADADALGLVSVSEKKAEWGRYFEYRSDLEPSARSAAFQNIARKAAAAGSVELELMVTALFLAKHGSKKPWDEVVERKRAKATDKRLSDAKELLKDIRTDQLAAALPAIA